MRACAVHNPAREKQTFNWLFSRDSHAFVHISLFAISILRNGSAHRRIFDGSIRGSSLDMICYYSMRLARRRDGG